MPYSKKTAPQKSNALTIIFALFFCMISVGLMIVDHKQPDYLTTFKSVLQTVIYPIQILANAPIRMYQYSTDTLQSHIKLQQENNELQKKQILIEAQLQRMIILDAENKRLRMLLKASSDLKQDSTFAQLISIDFNPYRHFILLNHGLDNAINIGQPVINQEGVIGQIMEVTPYSSRAILITDPNHLLPIQINRNGLRGIAAGVGKLGELDIQNIENNSDVKVGDLLITSGLDGRFPAGYAVSEVISVVFDANNPFAKITARPTANFDKLREVLIISPSHNTP